MSYTAARNAHDPVAGAVKSVPLPTPQQKADSALALWQRLRDLAPQERLRKLDEYEATLRAVAKEMVE